jgi:hypothetical protein
VRPQASRSFLKKRTQKLLRLGVPIFAQRIDQESKVFWFFFSKKNRFLPFPFTAIRPSGAEGS